MMKRKYRAGIAAVLMGAVLFSPLLRGMTCLEMAVGNANTGAGVAPAAELVGKSAVSGMIGCALTEAILRIDGGEWAELARVGTWVWIGVEAVRLVEAVRA